MLVVVCVGLFSSLWAQQGGQGGSTAADANGGADINTNSGTTVGGVTGSAPNDRAYAPDYFTVDFYKENVAYIGGGKKGGNVQTAYAQQPGNVIVRYTKTPTGRDSYYDISFNSQGRVRTNAFGATAYDNVMVSVSTYPYRLLQKYYKDKSDKDSVFGFLISRVNDNNNGWADGDSYMYMFKDNPKSDCFVLQEGTNSGYQLGGGCLRNNNGTANSNLPTSMNTTSYTSDKMRSIVAVDIDKAWAVGKGMMKVFNGKKWVKFSSASANNTSVSVIAPPSQVTSATNYILPTYNPPQKTEGCEANVQVSAFSNINDVQLQAVVAKMENRNDADTLWAVGDKSTLVRVIYTISKCPATTPCCATGAPCTMPPQNNTSGTGPFCVDSFCNVQFCVRAANNSNGSSSGTQQIGSGLPVQDTNLTGIALGSDGKTLIVTTNKGVLYESTDDGKSFTKKTLEQRTLGNGLTSDPSGKGIGLNGVTYPEKGGFIVGNPAESNQISTLYRYNCDCPANGNAGGQQQSQSVTSNNDCKWSYYRNLPSSRVINNTNSAVQARPTWNATAMLSADLGFLVGSDGNIYKLAPDFQVFADFGGGDQSGDGLKADPPANGYDILAEPPRIFPAPQPPINIVTMQSADVLRCRSTTSQTRDLIQNGKIANWSNRDASTFLGEQNYLYFLDPEDNCPVLDPNQQGQNTGNTTQDPTPPAPAPDDLYDDVYVDVYAKTSTVWKLDKRPPQFEISLPDSSDEKKSPNYTRRTIEKKDGKKMFQLTYTTIPSNNNPNFDLESQKAAHALTYNEISSDNNSHGNKQNTYHFACPLKPYNEEVEGPIYPRCGITSSQNNAFRLRIRALIPNFSLSPEITPIVFAVGRGGYDKRTIWVVRPPMNPYMRMPKSIDKQLPGYQGVKDSFPVVTNTGFKLQVRGSGIDRSAMQAIAIDYISGKAADTPILRKSFAYSRKQKPTHDKVMVELTSKANYINSFIPSDDSVIATITAPVYDEYMRRDEPLYCNGTNQPKRLLSDKTALLPPLAALGLEEGKDIDAQGKEIGGWVLPYKSFCSDNGTAVTSIPTEEAETDNAGNPTPRIFSLRNGLPDMLGYLSTLSPERLPMRRFPKIIATRISVPRAPLSYKFSYGGGVVTGEGVADGGYNTLPTGEVKFVRSSDYDQRSGVLAMGFDAEGKPTGDSVFSMELDSRYGYRLGVGYDVRSGIFPADDSKDRVHYFLLKDKGVSRRDSMALRKGGVNNSNCTGCNVSSSTSSTSSTSSANNANACTPLVVAPSPFVGVSVGSSGDQVLDSLRILDYDTTSVASDNGKGCCKVLWGKENLRVLVGLRWSNYIGRAREDTLVYVVDGYEGRTEASHSQRKIRFLRLIQEEARLLLGKAGGDAPSVRRERVRLGYTRDSVRGDNQVRGRRDSVLVRSNVKWYIKTKRRSSGSSGNTNNDTYGNGFGIWWDTVRAHQEWRKVQEVGLDIPGAWRNNTAGGGNNDPNDDTLVHAATWSSPYGSLVFKALQTNLGDGGSAGGPQQIKRDSIEVCVLGDSVCGVVEIEQDTGKVEIDLSGLSLSYYEGSEGRLCLGGNDSIEVKLPYFLEMKACGDHGSGDYVCQQALCQAQQTDNKVCKTGEGYRPDYDKVNLCDKGGGAVTGSSINRFSYKYEEELGRSCRSYCVQVLNRNESRERRCDTLKVRLLGREGKSQVEGRELVCQAGVNILVTPRELLLPRLSFSEGYMGQALLRSNVREWGLRGYDRSLFKVFPVDGGLGKSFVAGEDRGKEYDLSVQAMQDNEEAVSVRSFVRVEPMDVCAYKREALSDSFLLKQDSFWLRYRLLREEGGVRHVRTRYPLEGYGEYGKEYVLPAVENRYLWFEVESNGSWMVGGRGGVENKYRLLERPRYNDLPLGVSVRVKDTVRLLLASLEDFLRPRRDSFRLGVLDKSGVVHWRYDIHYIQRSYEFEERNVVLYPNPVSSRLYVRSVNGKLGDRGYVFVYDMGGNLIARRPYANGLIDFDFGTLPIGTYIVRVFDGEVFVTKRILRR